MLMFAFLVIALFCTQSSTDRSSRRVEPQLRWWFFEKCMIFWGFNFSNIFCVSLFVCLFYQGVKMMFAFLVIALFCMQSSRQQTSWASAQMMILWKVYDLGRFQLFYFFFSFVRLFLLFWEVYYLVMVLVLN